MNRQRAKNQKLTQKLAALENETKGRFNELQQSLTAAKADADALRLELTELQGDTVTIPVGEARPVGHRAAMVGVISTNTAYNEAEVQFGNTQAKIKVGTPLQTIVDGKNYAVTLTKVSSHNCTFSYAFGQISK